MLVFSFEDASLEQGGKKKGRSVDLALGVSRGDSCGSS